jgi:hypothetical protein
MMKTMSVVKRKLRRLREYGNVRGVLFFAQRRILSDPSRRRLARLVSRVLPPVGVSGAPPSPSTIELEREGFAMFDGILTPHMVETMRDHLTAQPVYAPYQQEATRHHIDDPDLPDSHIMTVVDEGLINCPHLLDVANHPRIVETIEGVFGCKPTIGYMSAWWSVPTADGKPRHAEYFHRDFDDVAFIKLFIYLSDVDENNGPHEFIRGSHLDASLRPIRRYTDAEVYSTYSNNRLVQFTGRAGTVFLENTTGLHRGLPVHDKRRLILQIVYSMLPMAYGPPKPYRRELFQPPSMPIDPYINRIYVGQS